MRYCQMFSVDGIDLTAVETDGVLTELRFGFLPNGEETETELLKKVKTELEEYFKGERTAFTFPYSAEGTAFFKAVWAQLEKIPYGMVSTYSDVAAAIGRPKSARAVGMACNRNPIAIIIPCHRVVGKSGSLTGYAGGLPIKDRLLVLENAQKSS